MKPQRALPNCSRPSEARRASGQQLNGEQHLLGLRRDDGLPVGCARAGPQACALERGLIQAPIRARQYLRMDANTGLVSLYSPAAGEHVGYDYSGETIARLLLDQI